MDYAFGSVLCTFPGLLLAIISYDIVCQWFVNPHKHMKDWPFEISAPDTFLTLAILKFHEPVHNQEDHQEFSCNLIKGMGNLDCEVPEHIWGLNNTLGSSTKTMGPSSRQDVLDNNFGFWNWLKYNGMGQYHCCSLYSCLTYSSARCNTITKVHCSNKGEEHSSRRTPGVLCRSPRGPGDRVGANMHGVGGRAISKEGRESIYGESGL